MRDSIATQLLDLNREFYQTLAGPFSETRSHLQPGVLQALESLPRGASVLELGCGHGLLAAHLQEVKHRGPYVGIDSSQELVQLARRRAARAGFAFVEADLARPEWVARMQAEAGLASKAPPPPFDRIYAFATLHHIPSATLRQGLAAQLRKLLSPGGRLALSVWNFLASPRLRKRIVPWSRLDLDEAGLEEGDFLLDWRHGGAGLRYVHHFTETELTALAAAAAFRVVESYLSDGEGGQLGRYQVWEPI